MDEMGEKVTDRNEGEDGRQNGQEKGRYRNLNSQYNIAQLLSIIICRSIKMIENRHVIKVRNVISPIPTNF